tara:strand:- start:342 stop:740 length:399 start_codon:yes stop_codon:yes gene_type:complete
MILGALALMIAGPADGEPRFELRDPESGEVLETLGLCTAASIDAAAGLDKQTNMPIVTMTLDERGRGWLGRVTTDYIDYRMAVIIDSEPLIAPIIHEPILGGELLISGGFTAEEAKETATRLNFMCEQDQTN